MPDNAPLPRIGDLIAELDEQLSLKDELDTQLDPIETRIKELKALIMSALDATGTTQAKGTRRSVSISESEVYSIEDDDSFHNYVVDNDAWYLLKREVISARARELFAMGTEVPGLKPFITRRLNVSKVKAR